MDNNSLFDPFGRDIMEHMFQDAPSGPQIRQLANEGYWFLAESRSGERIAAVPGLDGEPVVWLTREDAQADFSTRYSSKPYFLMHVNESGRCYVERIGATMNRPLGNMLVPRVVEEHAEVLISEAKKTAKEDSTWPALKDVSKARACQCEGKDVWCIDGPRRGKVAVFARESDNPTADFMADNKRFLVKEETQVLAESKKPDAKKDDVEEEDWSEYESEEFLERLDHLLAEAKKSGKTPEGNVYWRELPNDAKVELRNGMYVYKDGGEEKVVFWHGTEARYAQSQLEKMSRGEKGSFSKRTPTPPSDSSDLNMTQADRSKRIKDREDRRTAGIQGLREYIFNSGDLLDEYGRKILKIMRDGYESQKSGHNRKARSPYSVAEVSKVADRMIEAAGRGYKKEFPEEVEQNFGGYVLVTGRDRDKLVNDIINYFRKMLNDEAGKTKALKEGLAPQFTDDEFDRMIEQAFIRNALVKTYRDVFPKTSLHEARKRIEEVQSNRPEISIYEFVVSGFDDLDEKVADLRTRLESIGGVKQVETADMKGSDEMMRSVGFSVVIESGRTSGASQRDGILSEGVLDDRKRKGPSLKDGDRVMYSRTFVKNSGGMSKDVADRRGTVISVTKKDGGRPDYLKVKWDDEDEPKGILSQHLSVADKPDPVHEASEYDSRTDHDILMKAIRKQGGVCPITKKNLNSGNAVYVDGPDKGFVVVHGDVYDKSKGDADTGLREGYKVIDGRKLAEAERAENGPSDLKPKPGLADAKGNTERGKDDPYSYKDTKGSQKNEGSGHGYTRVDNGPSDLSPEEGLVGKKGNPKKADDPDRREPTAMVSGRPVKESLARNIIEMTHAYKRFKSLEDRESDLTKEVKEIAERMGGSIKTVGATARVQGDDVVVEASANLSDMTIPFMAMNEAGYNVLHELSIVRDQKARAQRVYENYQSRVNVDIPYVFDKGQSVVECSACELMMIDGKVGYTGVSLKPESYVFDVNDPVGSWVRNKAYIEHHRWTEDTAEQQMKRCVEALRAKIEEAGGSVFYKNFRLVSEDGGIAAYGPSSEGRAMLESLSSDSEAPEEWSRWAESLLVRHMNKKVLEHLVKGCDEAYRAIVEMVGDGKVADIVYEQRLVGHIVKEGGSAIFVDANSPYAVFSESGSPESLMTGIADLQSVKRDPGVPVAIKESCDNLFKTLESRLVEDLSHGPIVVVNGEEMTLVRCDEQAGLAEPPVASRVSTKSYGSTNREVVSGDPMNDWTDASDVYDAKTGKPKPGYRLVTKNATFLRRGGKYDENNILLRGPGGKTVTVKIDKDGKAIKRVSEAGGRGTGITPNSHVELTDSVKAPVTEATAEATLAVTNSLKTLLGEDVKAIRTELLSGGRKLASMIEGWITDCGGRVDLSESRVGLDLFEGATSISDNMTKSIALVSYAMRGLDENGDRISPKYIYDIRSLAERYKTVFYEAVQTHLAPTKIHDEDELVEALSSRVDMFGEDYLYESSAVLQPSRIAMMMSQTAKGLERMQGAGPRADIKPDTVKMIVKSAHAIVSGAENLLNSLKKDKVEGADRAHGALVNDPEFKAWRKKMDTVRQMGAVGTSQKMLDTVKNLDQVLYTADRELDNPKLQKADDNVQGARASVRATRRLILQIKAQLEAKNKATSDPNETLWESRKGRVALERFKQIAESASILPSIASVMANASPSHEKLAETINRFARSVRALNEDLPSEDLYEQNMEGALGAFNLHANEVLKLVSELTVDGYAMYPSTRIGRANEAALQLKNGDTVIAEVPAERVAYKLPMIERAVSSVETAQSIACKEALLSKSGV